MKLRVITILLIMFYIIMMTQSTIAAAPTIDRFGRQTIDREHRLIESKPILTINDENVQEEQDYQIYEVTAYTAGFESTGKTSDHPAYGITASGTYVRENHTIACGPELDFGTEIYIPYFDTTFVCEDRGGLITEGKLDVYMESVEDAIEFGRQQLEVVVCP